MWTGTRKLATLRDRWVWRRLAGSWYLLVPTQVSHRLWLNQQTTAFVPGTRPPVCILRLLVASPCLFVREMDRREGVCRS